MFPFLLFLVPTSLLNDLGDNKFDHNVWKNEDGIGFKDGWNDNIVGAFCIEIKWRYYHLVQQFIAQFTIQQNLFSSQAYQRLSMNALFGVLVMP